MLYLLPTDTQNKTNEKTIEIQTVKRSLRQVSSALSVFMATSRLVGGSDKTKIITFLKGLNTIVSDAEKRSNGLCENLEPVSADSSDETMLNFLQMERNTLQGIVQSTLHIVDRLHITNRMSSSQYNRVKNFYRAVVAMNDGVYKEMVSATK